VENTKNNKYATIKSLGSVRLFLMLNQKKNNKKKTVKTVIL